MIPSTLPPEGRTRPATSRPTRGSRPRASSPLGASSPASSPAPAPTRVPAQARVRSLPLSAPLALSAKRLRLYRGPRGKRGGRGDRGYHRYHRYRPSGTLLRRGLSALMLVLALSVTCVTIAWRVAPSTTSLHTWVQRQDATHSAPYTPLAAISPNVIHALIAVEDERFYQHHGIDTIGLARAALTDLEEGRAAQGGSTLTAQLAKNAYLGGYDHSPELKAEDLLLALKIEHTYSKSQILEMYLNLVYFGEGAYGIGAAAEKYFGIAPDRLDIAQGALLAGMVQAPGMYDPWCHPSFARNRQEDVLDRMVADGYITPAQEARAQAERFAFFEPGAQRPNDAYCAG